MQRLTSATGTIKEAVQSMDTAINYKECVPL
jgi:hypothetical protein